ncbi:MAG TPA: hypothetical protein O0X70_07185 [Methanocorpusculum sp.]|nr:hypothetical protein [Methanocorpusculum sp.]
MSSSMEYSSAAQGVKGGYVTLTQKQRQEGIDGMNRAIAQFFGQSMSGKSISAPKKHQSCPTRYL